MSLRSEVRHYMAEWVSTAPGWRGLDPDRPVLLAVSGGPDSLALLHLFVHGELHPRHLLHVAHYDHQLRPESAEDARFVALTAAAWGVDVSLGGGDVRQLADERGHSLEAAARDARYRFLLETARLLDAQAVAVAHNADDQAETVLIHLLRGSGLIGLRGMRPVTPAAEVLADAEAGAPPIIRPLLATPAGTIRAYCRNHDLSPRRDSTNDDVSILRNRLRHEILPLLEEINPALRARLSENAGIIGGDVDLLQGFWNGAWERQLVARGDGWLRIDREPWRDAALSVRRAVLRRAVAELAPEAEVGLRPLEQARRVAERGQVGTASDLPGGVRLTVRDEALEFEGPGVDVPREWGLVPAGVASLPLSVPGNVSLTNGWTLHAESVPPPEQWDPEPFVVHVAVPAGAGLHVRPRRPGERFRPLGMAGRKRLKQYFQERHVPAEARAQWPLVADEEGVLWVVGQGIGERGRVPAGARRCIRLSCRPSTSRAQH